MELAGHQTETREKNTEMGLSLEQTGGTFTVGLPFVSLTWTIMSTQATERDSGATGIVQAGYFLFC